MKRNFSAADPRRSPLLFSGCLVLRGAAGSPAGAGATARRRLSGDRDRKDGSDVVLLIHEVGSRSGLKVVTLG